MHGRSRMERTHLEEKWSRQREYETHSPEATVQRACWRTRGISDVSPFSLISGRGANETWKPFPQVGKCAQGTSPKMYHGCKTNNHSIS